MLELVCLFTCAFLDHAVWLDITSIPNPIHLSSLTVCREIGKNLSERLQILILLDHKIVSFYMFLSIQNMEANCKQWNTCIKD